MESRHLYSAAKAKQQLLAFENNKNWIAGPAYFRENAAIITQTAAAQFIFWRIGAT